MFRPSIIFLLFLTILVFCIGLGDALAQPPSGQTEKGKVRDNDGRKPPVQPGKPGKDPQSSGRSSKKGGQKSGGTSKPQDAECAETELLIHCDLPECIVLIDGKPQGITNSVGDLQVTVPSGKRNIEASKNGYKTMRSTVNVGCGELTRADLKLVAKPFEIKLRTTPPNCDVFINDPPKFAGKTDENGFFSLPATIGTVLVQARKSGYLGDSVSVSPQMAQKEILLTLTPMPAQIRLNTNVANAFAQMEGEGKSYDVTEPFWIAPGRRKLVIAALGHRPFVLDFDLQPNQRIEKAITLERLPVAELLTQANQFLKEKSYDKAMQLCRYVLEIEADNAAGNRLAGTIYLERKNYVEAEHYFLKALDGNESIVLDIRRHAGEKFELTSGHGTACEGRLRLTMNEIEYHGSTVRAENFKVSYGQIQIMGFQIKKNVALYLGLKVTDGTGKKRDYNFYSSEKELSQEGKLYLEMIQRLLRRNKT